MSRDHLRKSAATTLAVVWFAACGLALLVRAAFDLSSDYPPKVAVALAVVVLLALGHVGRHHPFGRFGPANQITTLRASIVALLAALMGERTSPAVAATVAFAGLASTFLDGVDGWMARRTRMASQFGARFDMEIDAALIQVLAILVWQYGKAGPWIVAAGLLRYGFAAAGWLWPWMRGPLASSLRGRAICVVQIAALLIAILPVVPPGVSDVIAGLGLLALGYSFAVDTVWLWRHAAVQRTQ